MSFVKIYLHCVWSTKNREHIIPNSLRPIVLKHFREYASSKQIFIDFVNLHLDHVHVLISLGKEQSIAQVMHLLKGESTNWMNKQKILPMHFAWQDDYYAASISSTHVNQVRNYIRNQDEHHRKMTWDEEIKKFLEKNGYSRELG